MLRKLVLSMGMVSICAFADVSEQVLEQARQLKAQALKSDLAYEVVESLTTEVGPRLAGTEQEARARVWSKATLASLGFEEIVEEPFDMPTWIRGEEKAQILSPFPQPLSITALGGSINTPREGITAPLVVVDDLFALKALPEAALEGKIVFVGHHMRKTQDGSSYGYSVPLRRDGASVAASKGALVILIKSIGTSSHRFPHTGQMQYAPDVKKIPVAAVSAPDAEQIIRIAKRGKPIEVNVTITPRALGEQVSGNIIADIKGSTYPEQVVVIGGHLDSWDLGTGAVDDGAGIAITTAAAKIIKDLGIQPKRTIRLIHWGAEEVGLLGARAYADAHKHEIDNHIIGAESDFGAGPIWQVSSRVSEDSLPVIKTLAQELHSLGIAQGNNQGSGGPDLIPLMYMGMPVVGLKQDGRDYFDLHHTPDDTLDKIDPQMLRQNVAAYVVFAWIMANTDEDFR